jgi:hypothetical protein
MAREEALGQLQRECAALEEGRATLKQREEEVSWLNGELVQISISHEDLRQSLEEQEASYLKLRREAEEARQSLEGRRSRLKVSSFSCSFFYLPFGDSLPSLSSLFMASRHADRPGACNHPGRDCESGPQLLGT